MGLRRLYKRTEGTETSILLQIHDAVLVQTLLKDVEEVKKIIRECLTIPITIEGKVITIPVDIAVGSDWNDVS